MMDVPAKTLFFGCGNMGGAILRGWINAGASPQNFHVISPSKRTMPAGVNVYSNTAEFDDKADIVVIGVKPQMLGRLTGDIQSLLRKDTIIISILAGIKHAQLQAMFPDNIIVRMMPNLAVEIGKSPMGIFAPNLTDDIRNMLNELFAPLGDALWVKHDEHIHIVTAMAGSGPAYLFRFIDALAGAGHSLGLPKDQALRLAKMMVDGASDLAVLSDNRPDELAAKVTSKAGTTAAGLEQLDQDNSLRHLIDKTVKAAHDRSVELSKLS